jgi:hypothetical protein
MIGFFCGGGSVSSTPHESYSPYVINYIGDTCVESKNDTMNDLCPPGHYCEEGSSSPSPCPQGSNSSSSGLTSAEECGICPGGYRCPDKGTVLARKLCYEGMHMQSFAFLQFISSLIASLLFIYIYISKALQTKCSTVYIE